MPFRNLRRKKKFRLIHRILSLFIVFHCNGLDISVQLTTKLWNNRKRINIATHTVWASIVDTVPAVFNTRNSIKVMPKIKQNLVFLMEPSRYAWNISLKAGNMCLNRFCIDEDAAFELSEVCYLERPSRAYFDKKFKSEQRTKERGNCCF